MEQLSNLQHEGSFHKLNVLSQLVLENSDNFYAPIEELKIKVKNN
jgi:hypothetical protein